MTKRKGNQAIEEEINNFLTYNSSPKTRAIIFDLELRDARGRFLDCHRKEGDFYFVENWNINGRVKVQYLFTPSREYQDELREKI